MFTASKLITITLLALALSECGNVPPEAQDQTWREVIETLNYYAALEDDAQGQLGLCKDTIGGSTPKNWEPFAEKWCIAAAKTSYPGAAQFLAEQYANGTFGEAKKSNADKWFENAKSDIARAAALERRYKELKAITVYRP